MLPETPSALLKQANLIQLQNLHSSLSPDNMQAQGYIQSVAYDVGDFWTETNELAENNEMDENLAYMYKMVKEAEENIIFKKKMLEDYGAKVN